MGLIEWADKRAKKMGVWDVGLTKLAVLFFTLLIVKFWPAVASLDWHWYALLGVAAALLPLKRFFSN